MLVDVTGRAGGAEAQVRPFQIDAVGGQRRALLVQPWLVAVLAGDQRVAALEGMACLSVVEGLPPGLAPPHELVLLSLMVNVALLAIAIVRARVQSLAGVYAGGHRPMASQTLLRGHALLWIMAPAAVGASLEGGVGPAQPSR
jgi:hypothetical protein